MRKANVLIVSFLSMRKTILFKKKKKKKKKKKVNNCILSISVMMQWLESGIHNLLMLSSIFTVYTRNFFFSNQKQIQKLFLCN